MMQPVPEQGEMLWFYANDQVKEKTEYQAKVIRVYDYWDSDKRIIYKYDDILQDTVENPIMDLWIENSIDMFWILNHETDYIIEIIVPDLCPQSIFVARDIDGGWHSMITITEKEFGILDVTGELYRKLHGIK